MEYPPAWDHTLTEDERVYRWRLHQFKTMRFEHTEADLLAASNVDLRTAERLIDAGCPHRLAISILTP